MIANSATSQMWEKKILKSSLWAQTIVLTSNLLIYSFPRLTPKHETGIVKRQTLPAISTNQYI